MEKFEVGKHYGWADGRFDPIKVLGRTDKTIRVRNATNQWRMRIRIDDDGNEYVVDSTAPKSYRNELTCKAIWHACDMHYKGSGSI